MSVSLTTAAASKISEIAEDNDEQGYLFVVSVIGGGCAGFQYHFSMEPTVEEDHFKFVDNSGITIAVDPISYQYVIDAEIDFVDDLSGCRFQITNPNAKSTCGCGSSFSPL